MTRFSLSLFGAALISGLALVSTAQATSIDVTTFSPLDFAAKSGTLFGKTVEDFEDTPVGQIDGPLSTSVGKFSTLGGTGSGNTVKGTPDSDGTDLYVRGAPVFGRKNTTEGGARFLDSNDTYGIRWEVSTGSMFDRILFTLGDASDSGANLTIFADGQSLTTFFNGPSNGKVDTILISFGSMISTATLLFENRGGNGKLRTNDGFSLDDMTVGASVPLPPAVLLLGAGVAALGGLRRSRRAA